MATTKKDRITIDYVFDAETSLHRWTFGHGIKDVTFSTAKPRPTDDTAKNHGYKQKIADKAAITHDTANGAAATLAEKAAAMQEAVDNLENGIWNGARGARVVNVDALVAAMIATLNKNVVGVRIYVEAKDEPGRKALADSAQFKAAYVMAVAQQRPTTTLDDATEAELDAIPE